MLIFSGISPILNLQGCKHKTKNEVVSFLNFDNEINVHPSNYQKKEAKIPLSFYQNLFCKIQNLFYEKYTFNDSKQHKIISVDGTKAYENIIFISFSHCSVKL